MQAELVHEDFLRRGAMQKVQEHQSRVAELRRELISVQKSLDTAISSAVDHFGVMIETGTFTNPDDAKKSAETMKD